MMLFVLEISPYFEKSLVSFFHNSDRLNGLLMLKILNFSTKDRIPSSIDFIFGSTVSKYLIHFCLLYSDITTEVVVANVCDADLF